MDRLHQLDLVPDEGSIELCRSSHANMARTLPVARVMLVSAAP
jgi:hypothetical protein